jgi:ABC-type dipeptide/oligopeptide/nickel transport system ATPase component
MANLKPKGERLKETITLLKKLPEVGVPRESYAYSQVQDIMNWPSSACAFADRCTHVEASCREALPTLIQTNRAAGTEKSNTEETSHWVRCPKWQSIGSKP